jgi:hypothetical protein
VNNFLMASADSTFPNRFIDDLRRKPVLLCALLVLATLLLYSGVAHHEFLTLDDASYVFQNNHVSAGLKLDNVVWAFTSYYSCNWHPVTWLSHMTDCQLFGLNSGSQHMVSVFLHAANVLLLFLLLQKATGAVWRSFLVAALFALHPLNVETVAWIAERKSLLCTFFSLLTVAAYGWYARQPNLKKYLVIVAAFSLALMSKPMAVSLPIVLLCLDYWPLERLEFPFGLGWVPLLMEKLPLLLMSAASSAVTVIAQRSTGAVAGTSLVPLPLRFENAIVSYMAYIGKTLWPANLAVFYPLPEHSLPWLNVIGSTVVLFAITAAVLCFHRSRYLVVGWCLFVVMLIPVIGIVQVGSQAMADRYAYMPCIGLFIMIAWGLNQAASNVPTLPRFVPAMASLCLVAAFATATTYYLQYWQNGVLLLTRASVVAGQPNNFIEKTLGDSMSFDGRYDEAFLHYKNACILRPYDSVCHFNMAKLLSGRNQFQEALDQYQIAGTYTNSKDMALVCLINSAEILLGLGDYETAEMKVGAALQIDPTNSNALQLRQAVINLSNNTSHLSH